MTGTLTSDGQGGLTQDPPGFFPTSTFRVTSGPAPPRRTAAASAAATASRTPLQRAEPRYSEQNPWPHSNSQGIIDDENGDGLLAERCEIVVLGVGVLGPSPRFDTVSYGPQSGIGYTFDARHDAVGLGGSNCAPANCDGDGPTSCYVNSFYRDPDPAAPTGCYAGASGPPPGTVLAMGETLTWAAAGDASHAYHAPDNNGNPSNRASAHGGWELCFA